MKENIRNIIDSTDHRTGRIVSILIQLLILISVVTFSMETIPDLEPQTRLILRYIEIFTVIIFTIEYLLRVYIAQNKLKFIFSFYGIIDFLGSSPIVVFMQKLWLIYKGRILHF